MKRILLLAGLILFFILDLPSYAAEDWVIENFQSDIQIQQDGKVNVEETIDVRFDVYKHGIFRDIPYRYSLSSSDNVYTDVSILSVIQDNSPANYSISDDGAYKSLKIGDPNITIAGQHKYKIEYTVLGILKSFDTYDELYWNVTGNNWDVPILNASAKIRLSSPGITGSTCYEGIRGSQAKCIIVSNTQSEVVYQSSRSLDANEGLTIVTGFKKGLFPIVKITPSQSFGNYYSYSSIDFFTISSLIAFILPIIIGALLAYLMWSRNGRDYKLTKAPILGYNVHDTIVVEFEPPEKLRPGEVGVLMDEQADTLDVTATIVDLAVRGFLTIEEKEKKWLFGQTDYILTKKDKDEGVLLSYEKSLLNKLFDEKDSVKISDLKYKFYEDLRKVKEGLYQDTVVKKLFSENPETVRHKYIALGIVVIVLGGIILFSGIGVLPILAYIFTFGLGILISGFILFVMSFYMPRRSANGHEMYRRVLGYKMFIDNAEKYRQKFFEDKNMFNEVLPYAIVFGLVDKFAKAFKDLGLPMLTNSWYISSRPFDPYHFGVSVNSFSNTLSSAIVQTAPRSSGFSSRGGFSGGGFGGGGGRSW